MVQHSLKSNKRKHIENQSIQNNKNIYTYITLDTPVQIYRIIKVRTPKKSEKLFF